jgi:hypothetical protein
MSGRIPGQKMKLRRGRIGGALIGGSFPFWSSGAKASRDTAEPTGPAFRSELENVAKRAGAA